MDNQTRNILYYGICYSFLVGGWYVFADLQKALLVSAHDDNPDFNVDGYTCLGIMYGTAAVSIWFAPSVIALFGLRLAILFGCLTHLIPPVVMFFEKAWLLYLAVALNGAGASLTSTGSFMLLVLGSTKETLGKHTGLFWSLYMSGVLPGNLLVFFAFQNSTIRIDEATRHLVLFGTLAVFIFATFLFLFLKVDSRNDAELVPDSPFQAFRKALTIAKSRNMIILSSACLYCGLHISLISSVYGSSIGFTLQLGEGVKRLIPLSALLIGCGQVLAALLVNVFGKVNILGINLFFALATIGSIICYAIAYLSLPSNANFGNTYDKGLIEPRIWLLLTTSFFLGVCDSFVNTQLFTIIGSLYPKDSAPAFTVFKFLRCVGSAAGFYYSRYLLLSSQLVILSSVAFLAMIFFNILNVIHERQQTVDKK